MNIQLDSSNSLIGTSVTSPRASYRLLSDCSSNWMSMEDKAKGIGSDRYTLPWIREERFGFTLGNRSNALSKIPSPQSSTGPSDLIHWGRHYGEKSIKLLDNLFSSPGTPNHTKEEDGYVGFFHYCNGIDYSCGVSSIEHYVLSGIGLTKKEGRYHWLSDVDVSSYGTYSRKQMVVTLCTYNTFARAELRARFIISVSRSHKAAVTVDTTYSLLSQASRKSHEYTSESVSDLSQTFWDELAVSTLVRLCLDSGDRTHQLCGTVNLPSQVDSQEHLRASITRVVSVMQKGYLTASRPRYGSVSTCGVDFVKTSKYRNLLIDCLVRIVALDSTSASVDYAINEIRSQYDRDFDIVVCRLLRADSSQNNNQRFLDLVHSYLTTNSKSCQSALLLIEQARFLISKHYYDAALTVTASAVELLPLDFDAWFNLALCYVLLEDFNRALVTINMLPVVFSTEEFSTTGDVDNTFDSYALQYFERSKENKSIDLRTFESFFPTPKAEGRSGKELASMEKMWHEQYLRRPNLRHPICGPFYSSPLSTASTLELAAVDPQINKLAGPKATKLALAAQSAHHPWSSILDFDSKSTYGRTYDLLSMIASVLGWDNLVRIKNETFSLPTNRSGDFVVQNIPNKSFNFKSWLQVLFITLYEDLRAMTLVSKHDHERSALSWSAIGFLGWSSKYNLKDSISCLHTSMSGVSAHGDFDLFSTVKILEIYNEFILSDVSASTIDQLSSVYDGRNYTNKLILLQMSPRIFQEFVNELLAGQFSLETILLCVTKLVCHEVRWYNYMPSSLVTETLIKLCAKYDSLMVTSVLQILFKRLSKEKPKRPAANLTLRAMFAAPEVIEENSHEFKEDDTIMEYMFKLISWIESLPKGTG